jgi:hypothetical protein
VHCAAARRRPRGDRVQRRQGARLRGRDRRAGTYARRHDREIGWRALAALGGDIIFSGGEDDCKVVTWNAASGEGLGEGAAGGGVGALAALDGGRFVAGTIGGDVVFYTHHGGCGVEESARIAGAHKDWVHDFAVCGGRLATTSRDKTVSVWSVDSRKRLAKRRGHTDWVKSVDMNDRLVVTSSADMTVRVYNAERGFSSAAVLDGLHTNFVGSIAIIGEDHILSASHDGTACVTQLSPSVVVARTALSYYVYCAAILPDGRLAVCGFGGNAALIDAPAAAAGILKTHGKAAFPEAAAADSVLAVAEPLTLQQDAVVREAAGEQTVAAACREHISADACSVSLAEWSAGHLLLISAVRGGEIEAF